jgi:hypothetical protein
MAIPASSYRLQAKPVAIAGESPCKEALLDKLVSIPSGASLLVALQLNLSLFRA